MSGAGDASVGAGCCAQEDAAGIVSIIATVKNVIRMRMASSAEKSVAGRTVGPVDLAVTVDTAPADQPVALVGQLHAVVNRGRMFRADVTALTEHRQLCHQHPFLVRSVRVVTGTAGLADRRVLPQVRSTLFGVTADA